VTAIDDKVQTAALVARLADLPANPTAALRVLWLLDDPDWNLADLGRIIESDPAFSARVIHLANSPFYGLSAQVSSALRAITVLGQVTVRAVAAVTAGGLLESGGRPVPAGFWAHAAATAAGSSLVARRLHMPASDAFTAGLLSDIGVALLHRHDPARYDGVIAFSQLDPHNHRDFERQVFGTDHATAGAAVLDAWRFPASLVEAVAQHHATPSDPDLSPLARCVMAGDALAHAIGAGGIGAAAELGEVLQAAGLPADHEASLIEGVHAEADALSALVAWAG
jgi:putative nucleotidyltransferase with HDIG domain